VEPVSHLGNTTSPLYLDLSALDPEKTNNPLSDFRFSVSYGDPQPVQVLARRSLGPVTLKYQINGGAEQSAATAEWNGGERFGDVGDVHYRIMRGNVTGTSPGDEVKVWFEASGGAVESDSFTYTARVESSNRVLVLAAEDYTGISPVYKKTSGPTYLSYYLDALAANGISADVYDVDANDRKAPSQLGVLSHYDAVIWYTGDDVLTREPGMAAGTASRLAHDEILAVRAYLNEGGRLFRTGKYASFGEAFGYEFNLETNAPCNPDDNGEDGCEPLQDDFLQYYLGVRTSTTMRPEPRQTASSTTSSASTRRSTRSPGRSAARAPTTRITAHHSSRPAGSCRRRSTRSSRAGPRRSVTARAGRSTPTPAPTTPIPTSPTSPTNGSRRRSACPRAAGTCPSGSRTTPKRPGITCSSRRTPSDRMTGRRCRT
jgi:hypothetical protein